MTDQTKITQLADNVAGDQVRTGAIRSFAQGGPTDAQREAGNYRKLHTSVHGMKIAIETEKGSERTGTGKNGKTWSVQMPAHYGYVKGTEGKDGDHVDVYLGPALGHPIVHVVDQVDHDTGRFDEHKALLGFRSRKHALDTYHQSFSDGHGPDRVGAVTSLPVGKFKDWLAKGKRKAPLGKLKRVRSFAEGGATDDEDTGFISQDDIAQSPQAVQEASEDSRPWEDFGGGGGGDQKPWEDFGGRPEYDEGKQFAIRAAKSVAPGIAGLGPVGMGAGAGFAVAGPPGAVVGGLGGAVASALTVSPAVRKFQEWLLDKTGMNADPREEAAFAEEHPYKAAGADILGGMVGMNPTQQGVGLGGRAVMGGLQGGFEAASQVMHGQSLDPATISMAAGAGFLMPGLNRVGRKVYGAGERVGEAMAHNAGYRAATAAGRPDMKVDAEPYSNIYEPGEYQPSSVPGSDRGPPGTEAASPYETPPYQPGGYQPNEYSPNATAPAQQDNGGAPPVPPQPMGPAYRPSGYRTPGQPANENVAGQTRPGTSPPENTALPPTEGTFNPAQKTDEFIARSKAHATPAAGSPGVDATLGTAHEMAPPRRDLDTVGSNPDHPLSVGSERDYRATGDSNIHPTSSGGTSRPTAETLEPAKGNIPSDQLAALNPDASTFAPGRLTQDFLQRQPPVNGPRPGITDPRAGAEPAPPAEKTPPSPAEPAEVTAPVTGEVIPPSSPKVQQAIDRLKAWLPENERNGPNNVIRKNIEIMQRGGPMAERMAEHTLRTWDEHPSERPPALEPPTIEGEVTRPARFAQEERTEETPQERARARGEKARQEGRPRENPYVGEEAAKSYNEGYDGGEVSPKEPSSLPSENAPPSEKPVETEKTSTLEAEGPKILEDLQTPGFNHAMVDEARLRAAQRKWERGNEADDKDLMDEAIQDMKDAIGAGKTREQKEAEAEAERRKGLLKKNQQDVIQSVSPEQTVVGETKRDADLKVRAAQSANSALEKFRPTGDEVIGLGEGPIKALQDRLWSAIEHATEENLGVNPNFTRGRKALALEREDTEVKKGTQETKFDIEKGEFAPAQTGNLRQFSKTDTPAQTWLLSAQKLVGTREAPRKFSPKQMMQFMTDERALAQNTKAAAKDVNDLRKIENDLRAGRSSGSQEVKNRDMAEDWLQTQPKAVREQWIKDHLSPASEEDIDHLNETARVADDLAKTQHEQDLEDKMTREVEIPQFEKDAQAAREKIEKARAEGAGRAGEDYKPASPWTGPVEIIKDMISDDSGRFDPKKAAAFLVARRGTLHDWWVNNMMPEMRSSAARFADPVIATQNSEYAAAKARILTTLWRAQERMFNRMGVDKSWEYIDRMERRQQHPEDWMNSLNAEMKSRSDLAFQEEKMYGSPAEYRENYLSHIVKNKAKYQQFLVKYAQQYGPTWFERERDYDFMSAARADGVEFKYNNPVEIVQHRLMAGENMKRIMHTLLDLSDMRQAFPVDAAPESAVKGEWQEIIAPNRTKWLIGPDVQQLWKNAVDTRDSMWTKEGILGQGYRGWMAYKSVWAPITLGLSFFHQLHIAVGVVQADNFVRGFKYTQGSILDKLKGGVSDVATNWKDPFFAVDKQFYWFGRKVAPDYLGKQVRGASMVDRDARTPLQDYMHQISTESGMNLAGPAEEEFHDWTRRYENYQDKQEWAKMAGAGAMKVMQDMQKPAFLHMIPNLKAASLYRTAEAYFKMHPDEWNDKFQRRLALRTIGKEIEDRYGEMFYSNLFTNRMAKEVGIGSMLSLSWNLGFVRHLTGGIAQMGEEALRGAPGVMKKMGLPDSMIPDMDARLGVRSGADRIAYQANSKAGYVMAYAGMTLGLGGLMTMALSGSMPSSPLDYVFPRVGGTNPDGSPRRISTMFFTREPVQVAKHAEGHGPGLSGYPGGLWEVLYNKMIIAPLVEAFKNRDFYGRELYDPSAPWLQQWGQLGLSTLKNHFNPIALQGGERAGQTGGGIRDKYVLPVAGLTPAPTYIERKPIQNRIAHLWREGPGSTAKPYGNRDRDLERGDARAQLAIARQKGDSQAIATASKRLLNTGLSTESLRKDVYGSQDVYQFKQLDLNTKQHLLQEMSPEDYQKYVLRGGANKDLAALIKEWNRLHPKK